MRRDKVDKLYHTQGWAKVRRLALERDHNLCQVCQRKGLFTIADTVHHKTHARDDETKFYELDNLESICRECHNKEHPEKGGGKIKIERDDIVKF